jgi:hypothetical protein
MYTIDMASGGMICIYQVLWSLVDNEAVLRLCLRNLKGLLTKWVIMRMAALFMAEKNKPK